jgi:hypothetical protein
MVIRPCQPGGSWKSKAAGRPVQPAFGHCFAPVMLPCWSAISATALMDRPAAGLPLGRTTEKLS